jgi:hypothetical protein
MTAFSDMTMRARRPLQLAGERRKIVDWRVVIADCGLSIADCGFV